MMALPPVKAGFLPAGVAAIMSLAAPVVQAQAAGLFGPAEQAPPPSGAVPEFTVRSRTATIDLGELERVRREVAGRATRVSEASRATDGGLVHSPAVPTLTLNLFDDAVLAVRVKWTEPTFSGGYALSGEIVGAPLGTMTLVVNGARVAGSVRSLDGTYRIGTVGRGLIAVSEVEEPPFECGVEELHAETPTHRH